MVEPPLGEIDRVFRESYGRAVAVLTRLTGNLDDAQEAVQEAFAEATRRWPTTGTPPSPVGWLITTARHKAVDRARRERQREHRHALSDLFVSEEQAYEDEAMRDDELRLLFTCCHPALGLAARVAMTLRLIGGLSTAEVARAFLTPEATMGQRLVRAKAKIRAAGIPYRIPQDADIAERHGAVLATVYLIFNEGYTASHGDQLIRAPLCDEAIRLGRLLTDLFPGHVETQGLLALMLLLDARRGARTGADGDLIPLRDQDRQLWNRSRIVEGQALLRRCLERPRPGPYQLQAAINAVHCDAATPDKTDWGQILQLYDQLIRFDHGPIVLLNRAVAVAEVEGPEKALQQVDTLELGKYHLFHAVRADLLQRLHRDVEAASALNLASRSCHNLVERAFLDRRRQTLLRQRAGNTDTANHG